MSVEGASRVTAIVPAAGASRRMGRPKLVLAFERGTIVLATLDALRTGGAARLCVVTREDDTPLREQLDDRPPIVVAFNPAPERGMLSSIVAGLEALGGPAALGASGEVILVCPADLPALAPATVAATLAALAAPPDHAAMAVPVHAGKRGHPLAIAPGLLCEIPELDPSVGLRQLLDRHQGAIVEVPVDDPGCVHDIDTPEDYRRLAGRDPG